MTSLYSLKIIRSYRSIFPEEGTLPASQRLKRYGQLRGQVLLGWMDFRVGGTVVIKDAEINNKFEYGLD